MKRFILIILCLLLSSHTCQKKIDNVVDRSMVSYIDTLSRHQLDSLFIADTLSFDAESDWIQSMSLTEDRKPLYKYVFIKNLTDSTGVIYTMCSYMDTLYIIDKRVIE